MVHKNISLAHSIQCRTIFFISFAWPVSLSCEECVCVCVYIYIYIYTYLNMQRLYMKYHCYQIILQVNHFYTNWEWCKVLTGYLSLGHQCGRKWANTWYLSKHFKITTTNCLPKCPNENQLNIPFTIQWQLQCFCNDWTVSSGSFCSQSVFVVLRVNS
jgi:hypothetical protein